MKRSLQKFPFLLFLICLSLCLPLSGCKGTRNSSGEDPPEFSSDTRLIPTAPGTEIISSDSMVLDISNRSQGYLVAQSLTADRSLCLQLTGPDDILYTYFLDPGETAALPLSSGNGTYLAAGYLQTAGSEYAALFGTSIEVTLENSFLPFLYPNQYVNFDGKEEVLKIAWELAPLDSDELTIIQTFYDYVITHISYDTQKAATVLAGYLPDLEDTLHNGTGICFDYAALTAALLRIRGIPCRLEIGYAGDVKHAWIDVYTRSRGWIRNAIEFQEHSWTRMDPTFASSALDSADILSYIGDGTNYTVQFTR